MCVCVPFISFLTPYLQVTTIMGLQGFPGVEIFVNALRSLNDWRHHLIRASSSNFMSQYGTGLGEIQGGGPAIWLGKIALAYGGHSPTWGVKGP
jgi:hypothetical protein